ncbi:MAG: OmpA family protein [Bacteroidales bacterium]|nr:OmpA family protein [Bacteroidales bacterium]
MDQKTNNEEKSFEELKKILISPEQQEIKHLKDRLDDKHNLSEEIGEVLSKAVLFSNKKSEELSNNLYPVIEKAVLKSVKHDPKKLSDALFPVMGPAIRKSISDTFRKMIQSLNQTLEYSFSINGLRWRFQAWVSRKPFAEVVLLNSLVYSIQQVYLIHKKTGLLLQQAYSVSGFARDPDMVSAMLSAIKDFVKDSFKGSQHDSLNTIQVGELTLWIEEGPEAILAAVIHGDAPEEIREILNNHLTEIHEQFSLDLENFTGDTTAFETNTEIIESCLLKKEKEGKKKKTVIPWIIFILILLLLGFWLFTAIRDHSRWSILVQRYQTEPGYLITGFGRTKGHYFINGLRDPLSSEPTTLLINSKISPDDIVFNLEEYLSMSPEFLKRRAISILCPEAHTNFAIHNQTLQISRKSTIDQWESMKSRFNLIWGVTAIDTTGLKLIPGEQFGQAKRKIESTRIYFLRGNPDLGIRERKTLDSLVNLIGEIIETGKKINVSYRISISGYADQTGNPEVNHYLSLQRAGSVYQYFIQHGISGEFLISVGKDFPDINDQQNRMEDHARRVEMKIITP